MRRSGSHEALLGLLPCLVVAGGSRDRRRWMRFRKVAAGALSMATFAAPWGGLPSVFFRKFVRSDPFRPWMALF